MGAGFMLKTKSPEEEAARQRGENPSHRRGRGLMLNQRACPPRWHRAQSSYSQDSPSTHGSFMQSARGLLSRTSYASVKSNIIMHRGQLNGMYRVKHETRRALDTAPLVGSMVIIGPLSARCSSKIPAVPHRFCLHACDTVCEGTVVQSTVGGRLDLPKDFALFRLGS